MINECDHASFEGDLYERAPSYLNESHDGFVGAENDI
jgi:hypothetical protein